MNNQNLPYYSYSSYLNKRYGKKVYRVGVDAGFSCPNRKTGRDSYGCTFCDAIGSRAPYINVLDDVNGQIDRTIEFLQTRYNTEAFILYFQAFSGTYADTESLRKIYDAGLARAEFSELIVSTRPDCIDEEKTDLLASYKNKLEDVWVELGLQTSHDVTLDRINRGHSLQDFKRAYYLLKERGLKLAVHLIFGLPGEGWPEIKQTIDFINEIKPDAVKIHNLHVPKETAMYNEYLLGNISLPSSQRHLEYCTNALRHLSPDIIVMRFTCDTDKERKGVPLRFLHKGKFLSKLIKKMTQNQFEQGDFLSNSL